jgi:hypothetical protein
MLYRFNPVTGAAPTAENRNPPTNAPTIPRTISRRTPSPDLLTSLLAMNPAINPKTSHAIIDIVSYSYEVKECCYATIR